MIHCKECKYLIPRVFSPSGEMISGFECDHEYNKGTWLSAKGKKDIPSYINKDCDCIWFERRCHDARSN